jgi:hypothetical protein
MMMFANEPILSSRMLENARHEMQLYMLEYTMKGYTGVEETMRLVNLIDNVLRLEYDASLVKTRDEYMQHATLTQYLVDLARWSRKGIK